MTPTVAIRLPALSSPDAQTTVWTASGEIAAAAKTTTIVQYIQTVVTLDVPAATRASVEIPDTGLYLIVLITGNLTMELKGADDIPLPQSARHCQALYLRKGDYSVTFAPGKHRLVCFASASAWVQRIRQALPLIHEITLGMAPHEEALIFPRIQLPGTMADYLLSLTYRSVGDISNAELDHFHTLNRIMAHYDQLLVQTRKTNASRRNYEEICVAFTRHCAHSLFLRELSTVEMVAAAIHVTPKTLTRAFHCVSNGTITPRRLLQHLRIAAAHQLLSSDTPVSVRQTAFLLGYADTSAFTKAYRKELGHLPAEARRFPEARIKAATRLSGINPLKSP